MEREVEAAQVVTTPPPKPTGPPVATGFAKPWVQPRGNAAVRGARVVILVVNGFDRRSQDPFSEQEALEFPWIDLCLQRVARHSADVDHEVLVWDNAYLPAHDEILDRHGVAVFEHPKHKDLPHGRALDGLMRLVNERTEYIVTIDTDSFPVRDGWLSDLISRLDGGASITGVWRDEMSPAITAYIHPSGLATRRRTLLDLNMSFQRAEAQDVAQNISLLALDQGMALDGMPRSNTRNAHFLMAGIYGDTIYHHGAGSRKASFWISEENLADERARLTLRDALFAHGDELIAYLAGEIDSATAESSGLRDVVALVEG